jgi:hypothetical protein
MAELKISCLGRHLYEQGVGLMWWDFQTLLLNASFGFNIHGIMILRHILLEVSLKRIKFAYHQKIDVKVLNCSLKTCLVCCVYYCLVPISFIWLPSGWVCWGEQYPNLAEVEPYNRDMRGTEETDRVLAWRLEFQSCLLCWSFSEISQTTSSEGKLTWTSNYEKNPR